MKNYRVLITAIGGFLGVKNIENLKKAKPGEIYVVGVDADETCMGSKVCDKFFKVSPGEKKEYVSEIINIIEKEKINFILPCSDEEAISLAKQKNKINDMGAELLCVDESSIEIISDKLKTLPDVDCNLKFIAFLLIRIFIPQPLPIYIWRQTIN